MEYQSSSQEVLGLRTVKRAAFMTAVTLIMLVGSVSAWQIPCPECGTNNDYIEHTYNLQYAHTSETFLHSQEMIGQVSNYGSTPIYWSATYTSSTGCGIEGGYDSGWASLGFQAFRTDAETRSYGFVTSSNQMGTASGETLYNYQAIHRYRTAVYFCSDHGYYFGNTEFDKTGHNKNQWMNVRYTEGPLIY